MSIFNKIDHLGIAVPDLQKAIKTYETLLGSSVESIEEVEDQKVRTAFFSVGESHFELLEAMDESSPIARFLEKRPRGGLHHVCVEVEHLEEALAQYKKAGIRLIDEVPRIGAHQKRIAFVHPASTGGVLLELSEKVKQVNNHQTENQESPQDG